MIAEKSEIKKSKGRQPGWRKETTLDAMLPAIRISSELEEWLLQEKDKECLSKLGDLVRMKLMKEMRASKGRNDAKNT